MIYSDTMNKCGLSSYIGMVMLIIWWISWISAQKLTDKAHVKLTIDPEEPQRRRARALAYVFTILFAIELSSWFVFGEPR